MFLKEAPVFELPEYTGEEQRFALFRGVKVRLFYDQESVNQAGDVTKEEKMLCNLKKSDNGEWKKSIGISFYEDGYKGKQIRIFFPEEFVGENSTELERECWEAMHEKHQTKKWQMIKERRKIKKVNEVAQSLAVQRRISGIKKWALRGIAAVGVVGVVGVVGWKGDMFLDKKEADLSHIMESFHGLFDRQTGGLHFVASQVKISEANNFFGGALKEILRDNFISKGVSEEYLDLIHGRILELVEREIGMKGYLLDLKKIPKGSFVSLSGNVLSILTSQGTFSVEIPEELFGLEYSKLM